jgi:hypothetical protein
METFCSYHIGKNLLTLGSSDVFLQKTAKSKAWLIFWDCFMVVLIATVATIIIKTNQPLRLPKDLVGWLCLAALVIAPIFYLVNMFHSTYNECKPYRIAQNDSDIILNGKNYAPQSQANLVVKKKVGWQGLGVAYEVQLRSKRKKRVLSFGNTLEEATHVASHIGHRLGLPVKRN